MHLQFSCDTSSSLRLQRRVVYRLDMLDDKTEAITNAVYSTSQRLQAQTHQSAKLSTASRR